MTAALFKYEEWNSLYSQNSGEIYPLYSGYQCCPPSHYVRSIRDHYLLCCVQSGYGTFYDGTEEKCRKENTYRLEPGQSFLVRPGHPATWKAAGEDPWVYAWIAFSGRKVDTYLQDTDFYHQPVAKTGLELYGKLYELTRTTCSMENPALMYAYASSALWSMIVSLIQHADRKSSPQAKNPYVEKAIAIMQNQYGALRNVSELAAELGISREHFYTLFKQDVGKSPSQYLLDVRMQKACSMLQNTKDPVGLIAARTGFSDKAYFSHKFREIMGMSPGTYRKYRSSFPLHHDI